MSYICIRAMSNLRALIKKINKKTCNHSNLKFKIQGYTSEQSCLRERHKI